jgi:two-component system, NarL family, nitrate/nitrite response regulator NarL
MQRGIVATCDSHAGMFEIVATGRSAFEAITLSNEKKPDVVLMDINIPGGSLQTVAEICSNNPNVKLAILTLSEGAANVSLAFAAGAKGFISKSISCEELLRAIISISNGNTYVSPELAGKIFAPNKNDTATKIEAEGRLRALNSKETKILELLNSGKTNKDIASQLAITEKTVKYYLTTLFGKLAVKNRLEAVIFFRDAQVVLDQWTRH